MIKFIVAPGHGYTFRPLRDAQEAGIPVPAQLTNYRKLFDAKSVPPGIWAFCDIERLAVWELGLAGEIARLMRERGWPVINDPARAAARYELLLRLHQAGFNHFRAWRAEDGIPDARFPVFLRIESNHKRPVSDLIKSRKALAAAIEEQRQRGVPLRGMLIVEYAAEPIAPGVFRKYGAYRFGDRIVADHMVHDVVWAAKYGDLKAWTNERFAEEAAYVRDNPHAEALMRAFTIAGIEYGRADYGLIDGEVQVWEINTNPALPSHDPKKNPRSRREALLMAREQRFEALAALDRRVERPRLELTSEMLDAYRKRQDAESPDMVRE
jgi:hypothetical protein